MIELRSGGVLHVDGPAGAVPVLFLHGLGGGAWSWKPQRAALRDTRRLFLWEARGHGAATPVDDAGFADYYADAREGLAAVLDDAHRPAFVVGHSAGGLLALALACDVAGGIAGLFLIDPAYGTGDELILRLWLPLGRVAGPLAAPLTARLTRRLLPRLFARGFEDRARAEEAWPDQAAQMPFEYPRIYREGFTGPAGFELRDFAREISDPTFLLEGSGGLRRPRFPRLVKTFQERLGDDFRYEAIPGGHYLQLDRPDEVNERLGTFLATYAATREAAR